MDDSDTASQRKDSLMRKNEDNGANKEIKQNRSWEDDHSREDVQEEMDEFKEKPESNPSNQNEGTNPILDEDAGDDWVVDVSPNGHSISSLNSYIGGSSRVSHMKDLYVYDNTFTILPRSISRLNNLKTLKIFSNEVRLLPDEIGNIIHLEHLQMKVCTSGLGNLPSLSKLNSLKTLELHQTPFRPSVLSIPPEISKLQLLTRLAICNFAISFLPPEIGRLKNLEELDISFNKLKTLPSEISSLVSLRHLRAENNKLTELPSGLACLPKLSSIDVAHNKLTSLESLGLSSMTSLRLLNAKFNKLRGTCEIPEWITCSFEGNPTSHQETASSSDQSSGIDSDLLPSTEEGDECSSPAPATLYSKDANVPKNPGHGRKKHLWKRHGIQQLQARQDRLNLSRKTKVDISSSSTKEGKDCALVRETASRQIGIAERSSLTAMSNDSKLEVPSRDTDLKLSEGGDIENSVSKEYGSTSDSGFKNGNSSPKNDGLLPTEKGDCNSSQVMSRESTGSDEILLKEDVEVFTSNLGFHSGLTHNRRKGSSFENPKPMKRRKSVQAYSGASYAYRTQSLIGLDEPLQDGFYDAGREHPFCTLEALESQHEILESREVILVDREHDEDLDVIALSAQNFLARLDLAGHHGEGGHSGLTEYQKAVMLSLFVSDCFGGSDKTLNVSHARRGVLGGRPGIPFLCSCSNGALHRSRSGQSINRIENNIPSVHMLCEASVKLLKIQRQSNVIPLGLLPYGVCRHRAILFKYLCDRTSIPCELVRGYLDYAPHAWNVIVLNKENARVRMLVDACRPLDIREENDSEYFCRYIPFRRFLLPLGENKNLEVAQSEKLMPLLLDEIGSGASGSVVRKCSLGTITVAAKVHLVGQEKEMQYKDVVGRFLSELRTLCSLGKHPHIVSYRGHEFNFMSSDCGEAIQLTLFMDYVKGSSLEILLSRYAKAGKAYMPMKEAFHVSKSILEALSHVHSKGIVHRDVKSSNILVDLDVNCENCMPIVKLCDFDSAVPLSSSAAHTCYLAHRGVPPVEVCVGTPRWMAPEVFQAIYSQQAYSLEVDMWSFGCLLYEMLTLQIPYAGVPEAEIQTHIEMGHRPELPLAVEGLVSGSESDSEEDDDTNDLPTVCDEELKIMKVLVNLFKSCTESSARNRPTALEALRTLSTLDDVIDLSTESDEILLKTDVQLQVAVALSDEQSCVEENTMDNCPIEKEATS